MGAIVQQIKGDGSAPASLELVRRLDACVVREIRVSGHGGAVLTIRGELHCTTIRLSWIPEGGGVGDVIDMELGFDQALFANLRRCLAGAKPDTAPG